MKGNTYKFIIYSILSASLLSIGYLLPHCGAFILVAFVPLLVMDSMADSLKGSGQAPAGAGHFWLWHYLTFVLWNALTTFWVCNATVAGGIFAILANAMQMSVIWAVFRFFKKRNTGSKAVPYIFLAAMWIAWERFYFDAEISWPWLVLGNAFAGTTSVIQWYDTLGTLGGSLWAWACNLSIFGIICAVSTGRWQSFNTPKRTVIAVCTPLLFLCPPIWSACKFISFHENGSDGSIATVILQPNIDPYNKFVSLTQEEQNSILCDQIERNMPSDSTQPVLFIAPETFTSDVRMNTVNESPTILTLRKTIADRPWANILFGASAYEFLHSKSAPSYTARHAHNDIWYENYNTAIMLGAQREPQIYKKSRLVVGVEKIPYPRFFGKVEEMLGGYLMGHCIGQEHASTLDFEDGRCVSGGKTAIGCAVCYESIYPEYFASFVAHGAKVMTVITNDAWWGDTPGYKQHLNYSRLRAIETRRDIARCANTGLSAFINQRGDILSQTKWWEKLELQGEIRCNSFITPFVRFGDIVGRLCSFVFLLLGAAFCIRLVTRR